MNSLDDEALDEFREFFAARSNALMRDAFMLTGDQQTAEELLQEAMVKLVVSWTRVKRGGFPEAYVRKVMLNEVRSRWRRRTISALKDPLLHSPTVTAGDDPVPRVVDRDLLRHALASLTQKQRAVLFLRYFEDLTERETASRLGVSLGTVKSQTHAALQRLGTSEDLTTDSEARSRN